MHSDPHLHSRELKRRDFDLPNKFENASHTAYAIARAHVNTLRCVTRINKSAACTYGPRFTDAQYAKYILIYRC